MSSCLDKQFHKEMLMAQNAHDQNLQDTNFLRMNVPAIAKTEPKEK